MHGSYLAVLPTNKPNLFLLGEEKRQRLWFDVVISYISSCVANIKFKLFTQARRKCIDEISLDNEEVLVDDCEVPSRNATGISNSNIRRYGQKFRSYRSFITLHP